MGALKTGLITVMVMVALLAASLTHVLPAPAQALAQAATPVAMEGEDLSASALPPCHDWPTAPVRSDKPHPPVGMTAAAPCCSVASPLPHTLGGPPQHTVATTPLLPQAQERLQGQTITPQERPPRLLL